MRPLRRGPTQGHSAAAAGRKADCQTRQRSPPRKRPAACLLPTPAARSYSSTSRTPRSSMEPLPIGRHTRTFGTTGVQGGAPGAAADAAAAAITVDTSKPSTRSLALFQHVLPLGQARRESVQVTFWPAALRVPSRRVWAPGGHSNRPLEIAPLYCSPTQGSSAAAAGCKVASNADKGDPPTACLGMGPLPAPARAAARAP